MIEEIISYLNDARERLVEFQNELPLELGIILDQAITGLEGAEYELGSEAEHEGEVD